MSTESTSDGTLQPYEVPGPGCWMLTSGKSNSAMESEEYEFQNVIIGPILFQLEAVGKKWTLSLFFFFFSFSAQLFSPSPSDFILERCLSYKISWIRPEISLSDKISSAKRNSSNGKAHMSRKWNLAVFKRKRGGGGEKKSSSLSPIPFLMNKIIS